MVGERERDVAPLTRLGWVAVSPLLDQAVGKQTLAERTWGGRRIVRPLARDRTIRARV